MLSVVIPLALVMLVVAMGLNLWRLAKGPTAPDRILALDTLAINTIALVMLIGIAASSTAYFEAALLIALFGFVATVALARYVMRGDVLD